MFSIYTIATDEAFIDELSTSGHFGDFQFQVSEFLYKFLNTNSNSIYFLVDLSSELTINHIKTIRSVNRLSAIFVYNRKYSRKFDLSYFQSGADSVFGKDTTLKEISIRFGNVRSKSMTVLPAVLGPALKLFEDIKSIYFKNTFVRLSTTEYQILSQLVKSEGETIPRTELLETKTLDVHIMHIKRKIQAVSLDIKSVRGMGYKLVRIDS